MSEQADLSELVRREFIGMLPYGAPQIDVPVRLNNNENPYPPSPELGAAVASAAAGVVSSLNRYPDRDATELRRALARYLGCRLSENEIWVANGSLEIIQQIFLAFGGPGRTAIGVDPAYALHERMATITSTGWLTVPAGADFDVDPLRVKKLIEDVRPNLIFLVSPNNPTGTALSLDVIEAACEAALGLVVVDEAYAEFARPEMPSALTLLSAYPRLLVTRTMSKAFGLAGLRVGYLAAQPEVIENLLLVRLPFHLSAVTQAMASAALLYKSVALDNVRVVQRERDETVIWLRAQGLLAVDSDANFVLFGKFRDRHAIWEGLLAQGVLVREAGPPQWLRVTIGTSEEMTAFRVALRRVLAGDEDEPPAGATLESLPEARPQAPAATSDSDNVPHAT
jgi:histidinol-phosphate aminotransferase